MYARLTQYLFRIEDQRRWVDNLKRLQARREHEDPEGLALVAGLEGCRGVWFLVPDDDPPYEELIKQGEDLIQRGEVGSFEQRETIFSLWDTREQAESVPQHLGDNLARFFGDVGVTLAKPPDAQLFRVEGGQAQ